jgi:thiol-disulfide isomerase/thioredoxin
MIAAGPAAKRPPHIVLGEAPGAASSAGRCLGLLIVAAMLLVVSTFAASTFGPAARADDSDQIKVGEFIPAASPQPAPEISVTDLDGNPVALSDFKGKFVLLNLWATWCQPCIKEMPSLVDLQKKFGSALTVVAVSEDHRGEVIVKLFVQKLGLDTLKIGLDPKSAVSRAFDVRGLPSSFLIDPSGKIVGKVEGAADWDSDQLRAVLIKYLAPAKPS